MSGSKGLVVTSPDKQYSVDLHGYVQLDDRTFLDGGAKRGLTDTFLVRSARPIIDAKMTDYFDTRFMVDFGKGQTTLLDAYGNFHPMPGNYDWINLRAGEFKVPVGLERWQSESDVLFVERGQTTNLVPYRDIGVMAYGYPLGNQLEYEIGIMNGAADYQANTGDTDQDKDVAGAHLYASAGVDGCACAPGLRPWRWRHLRRASGQYRHRYFFRPDRPVMSPSASALISRIRLLRQ